MWHICTRGQPGTATVCESFIRCIEHLPAAPGPDTLICQQRLSCKVNGEAKILIDKNMSLADHGVLDNSEIYVDLDPELGFKLSVLHEGRLSTLTLEDGDKSNPAKCYNVVDVACAYKRSTGGSEA